MQTVSFSSSMDENQFLKAEKKDSIIDNNGKIQNHIWLQNFYEIYSDEPFVKSTNSILSL